MPGFDPGKAREFLGTEALRGVRNRQAILDLVRLCRMRRVDGVPITDPDWLAYQETLWPYLEPVLERQRANGGWAPADRDRTGWFHTTPWILVFLGYLGLNGTVSPALERIGSKCVDGATWLCEYKAHRSVLLGGKRRTVSWRLNLEPVGKPSPWLPVCGLAIDRALKCHRSARPEEGT
jgi:hypothetical protein